MAEGQQDAQGRPANQKPEDFCVQVEQRQAAEGRADHYHQLHPTVIAALGSAHAVRAAAAVTVTNAAVLTVNFAAAVTVNVGCYYSYYS